MHPIPWIEDVRRGAAYDNAVAMLREGKVVLPTLAQLADPASIAPDVRERVERVDPDAADPLNLFRVHWHNGGDRRSQVGVPVHVVLPSSLTGVESPIAVLLADRFPLIRAHKVLAAYGCLVPRLVSGHFDPRNQRAAWPSTGHYCRGGVAISRLLGCESLAILPEGMSRERFDWLAQWTNGSSRVITTSGSESNVREIYNKCHELEEDPRNVVFNQFREFGNYLVHYHSTGRAFARVIASIQRGAPELAPRAFVAATGSGGTLAAGDYLKDTLGLRIVAAEPLECPTMLYNGFGEHNIQGIGDKHISLIHNVMNTDVVAAVSDQACDALNLLFNTPGGQAMLQQERGVPQEIAAQLRSFGLSSICNVLAAIKTARLLKLGATDLIVTVATDGAEMYDSERVRTLQQKFSGAFTAVDAANVAARYLDGVTTDHVAELAEIDRERVFNLGYYTWVEQERVSAADFEARRSALFWDRLKQMGPAVDALITEFNGALVPRTVHA